MRIDTSNIRKVLEKLHKKDPSLCHAVQKKILQISRLSVSEISHFKNLTGSLSGFKRVHVGSFVLMFAVSDDTIIFDRLIHHDNAY